MLHYSQVSFVLGAIAAAASVTVMIPMDTIKTRLVIQVVLFPPLILFLFHCLIHFLHLPC